MLDTVTIFFYEKVRSKSTAENDCSDSCCGKLGKGIVVHQEAYGLKRM